MTRLAFITNFCPHYRIKTFETLASYYETDYYFFSTGQEWYQQQERGIHAGTFHHEYLPGVTVGSVRVTPTLPIKLWQGNYDVYIKCINGRFVLPLTFLLAHMRGRPFILWTGIWMRLQTPLHRLFYPVTRAIYHNADAVVVYGTHVKQFLLQNGVRPERIFVASHAVDNTLYSRQVTDMEKAALRHQLAIKPEQRVVLYLGRLEAGKGVKYLLEAFAQVSGQNTVLVLAGTGSEEVNLRAQSESLGITDRVRFAGYVPPASTVIYYALAWTKVLPSVTTPVFKEPWGLVVNEAFNQGVPVITTDAVGASQGGFVSHGVNGLIVPEQDSDALADALHQILEYSELRASLAAAARSKIATWDNELMVKGFRNAIQYVSDGTACIE